MSFSFKYLQSIHAVNLNKINNTFDHLIIVIVQLLSKKIDRGGNQKHITFVALQDSSVRLKSPSRQFRQGQINQ